MDTLIYLVYLHSIQISHRKLHEIFGTNTDYKTFFDTINEESLLKYFEKKQVDKILQNKASLDTNAIEKCIGTKGVTIITINDGSYPENLKQIANPPYLLYVLGKIDSEPKLAVIGSRKMTEYGKKIISNFVPEIARYFTIISGGAFGCDSYAHKKTIQEKGQTIAVIGTGIDIAYPQENTELYIDIVKNGGAIISIFPIGTPGSNYTFPMRNEIISGISSGVLVVEAAEKSGTSITVKLALDQGKEVFAVPGDIYHHNSSGCLEFIKKGEAKMVTTPFDIFEEYNIGLNEGIKSEIKESLTPEEKDVYSLLILEELTIDDLAKKLERNTHRISIILTTLELKGIIEKGQGNKYQVR